MMLTVVGNMLRPTSVTDTVGMPSLFETTFLAARCAINRTASTATITTATIASSQMARRAVSHDRLSGPRGLASSAHAALIIQ